MSEGDVPRRAVDSFGKSVGMAKRSGAWYGSSPETWTVLQLQKSQYKLAYYVNVGFWLRAAGDRPFPNERDFHVRIRLGALLPSQAGRIERLLDLTNPIPDHEREGDLAQILRSSLLPLLERGSTLEGLQDMYRKGLFRAGGVRGEAMTLLSVGDQRVRDAPAHLPE